jgi:aldehyde:ferredoxin oxidoreductase
MSRYGYHGKILHVDLGARRAWIEEPDERFWRIYSGGGLLAAYYLLRECPRGVDAFDPANLLILTSSVIAGHSYASLARFTAAAKSPLTGGIGETRGEGPFGVVLKGSGADALIVHGTAERATNIVIENGAVEFYDAQSLWGLRVSKTVDALEKEFGADIHTAVIGPAGENRVRFASIVTERSYQAARMGIGAVMGSKRVKAIVIRGDHHPPVANPAHCAELTEHYRGAMRDNSVTRWQLDPPGFSAWIHNYGDNNALCVRNYRDADFESAANYAPEKFMPHYRRDGDCPGCPNNCIKFFDDPRAGGIHQEIAGSLGSNLGIADLNAILQANTLCNDLGLDPASLGFTLSMAMECVERGILDQPLRFGDAPAMLVMIEQIARREGFGNVLAEGVKRAAEIIGGDASRYALHVKGLEMVCFDPRTQTGLGLGYATAPIGPRYEICEHDMDFDQVGPPQALDASRTLGILDRIPMDELSERKVRNFNALMILWSAADALDICPFAIPPVRVFTLHDMAEMLRAVTGWETSTHELWRFGERRLHLMRVYNLREGLTAAADTLPARFFDDPIHKSGRFDGKRLDREQFVSAVRTYYHMMGWDDAGRPRYETLLDYHLEWTVEMGHAERV